MNEIIKILNLIFPKDVSYIIYGYCKERNRRPRAYSDTDVLYIRKRKQKYPSKYFHMRL